MATAQRTAADELPTRSVDQAWELRVRAGEQRFDSDSVVRNPRQRQTAFLRVKSAQENYGGLPAEP